MANKATKDLLILGALGAAAAAGYLYYDHKKDVPEGCLPQNKEKTQDKSVEKPPSPPGTEAKNDNNDNEIDMIMILFLDD